MIDIATYRFRVGVFNANVNARSIKQMKRGNTLHLKIRDLEIPPTSLLVKSYVL